MSNSNRELLVLLNQKIKTQKDIDMEVSSLHRILYETERLSYFASSYEVLDLVKFKIHKKNFIIKQYLKQNSQQPFIFFFNMN